MGPGAAERMILTVFLSGENLPLARAELSAATQRLGGRPVDPPSGPAAADRADVELPSRESARELSGRLALAHRCMERWPAMSSAELESQIQAAGASGSTGAFQWISGSPGPRDPGLLHRLGDRYRAAGGRIALQHPDHRWWLAPTPGGGVECFEEVARVDRGGFSARSTPRLPFQRPVTLAPRLARALVNLAQVGPGDRVVDPFVGTGSLLLEASLLGAHTVGIDANATMIRGAIQNFSHFGLTPDLLRQGDAAEAAAGFPPASFDALVTDPPYGRASGTGGEPPERLWRRALEAWTRCVRPGGRLSLVIPAGAPVPPLDSRLEVAIPQRVHRSLTREFRVYVRDVGRSAGQNA